MGSTAKLIFSSILAVSIISMFLIFSMQKSAQLTLDAEVKDEIIANIQHKLEGAEASAKEANSEIIKIPKLQASIETITNEKGVYKQQVDELQQSLHGQLQKTADILTEFSNLQETQKEQQLLIEEAKQTTEKLLAMQTLLKQRDEEKSQFLTDIEQKDKAITFYIDKVDTATDTITTMQSERDFDQINLVLVLDDLAMRIQYIAELTEKIEHLTGSTTLAGTGLAHPKPKLITTVSVIESLIKRLQLESAPPEEDPVPATIAELEDLKVTNTLLRSSVNEQSALFDDLQNTLQEKEEELSDAIKQGHEIATPLTERITSLELQLEEAQSNNTTATNELNAVQKLNSELGNRNNSLDTDLKSTQVTLEESLLQIAQLGVVLETANSALEEEKASTLLISSEMESVKLSLSETEEQSNTLSSQYGKLETELASKNEENTQQAEQVTVLQEQLTQQIAASEETATLKEEIVQFVEVVAAKELAIESLTTQVAENNTQVTSLQADLDSVNEQASAQQNETLEQEEKIAELTEAIAAAQIIFEEQSLQLKSAEEQLVAVEENTANSAAFEEKILTLEATLSTNQEEITALQATITSLTEERDQLLLKSGDSDNDGVSNADDSCPDTLQNATVNAEGCEEDTDKDGLVNRLDLCPDTGNDATVDKAGCSEEQTIVILDGINFQFGTAELTEDASPSLDNTAIILLSNPDMIMEISGHTDSVGEKETNQQISALRAQAVMAYLVSKGVSEDRLQARGYGAEEPVADNATKSGRAQNRRVELRRIDAITPQQ